LIVIVIICTSVVRFVCFFVLRRRLVITVKHYTRSFQNNKLVNYHQESSKNATHHKQQLLTDKSNGESEEVKQMHRMNKA